MASEYEGTKITDIATAQDIGALDGAKVLIVTDNNQFLLPVDKLVDYIKAKVNE